MASVIGAGSITLQHVGAAGCLNTHILAQDTNTGTLIGASLCRHCHVCLFVTNQDHINILEGAYLYYQIQDSSRDPLTTAW